MTAASQPRRRKGKPYNPALAEYQAKVKAEEEAKRRDRKSRDLLRNATVAADEIIDPISGEVVTIFRSIRKDPLGDMHARKHVTECEYETGRHWQRAYEDAEVGDVRGIDPSKEAVDGGRMREVLTDRQVAAMKELKLARDELGNAGNWLIISILGTKKTIEMVAWEWKQAKPGDAQYRYIRNRFHECLRTLSVLFGYSSEKLTKI